jgi:transcriptional regulator with XRE-family HTH domain
MTPKKKTPATNERAETINEHLGRRVKKLRGDCGWSLDNLAQASGVSRSMLSEIEREKANPTLAVTYRIASAFGLGIAELIETSEKLAAIQVVRASDRGQVYRSDKNCQIRTLSPLNLEKDVEFYEVTVREKASCAALRTTKARGNFSPWKKAPSALKAPMTLRSWASAIRPPTARTFPIASPTLAKAKPFSSSWTSIGEDRSGGHHRDCGLLRQK